MYSWIKGTWSLAVTRAATAGTLSPSTFSPLSTYFWQRGSARANLGTRAVKGVLCECLYQIQIAVIMKTSVWHCSLTPAEHGGIQQLTRFSWNHSTGLVWLLCKCVNLNLLKAFQNFLIRLKSLNLAFYSVLRSFCMLTLLSDVDICHAR